MSSSVPVCVSKPDASMPPWRVSPTGVSSQESGLRTCDSELLYFCYEIHKDFIYLDVYCKIIRLCFIE